MLSFTKVDKPTEGTWLYFMYFLLMGICGFEDIDYICDAILQREDTHDTLEDLHKESTCQCRRHTSDPWVWKIP